MKNSNLLFAALLLTACQPAPESYDVLIKNGSVYDGTLSPAQNLDIGITDGEITSMSASPNATAVTVIDATGKIVVPGFIDPHTHAGERLSNVETRSSLNYLQQGVTTVFIGSDGRGIDNRAEYLTNLETQGIGPNVAFLAGHGGIRRAVMGMADRAPSADELQSMRDLLRAEMRAGAFGLSTGLYYAPGSYSTTDEVIELAKTAASFDGIYDTHMRSEGSNGDGLLAAVEEALQIGRQATIDIHISHIKALGQDVWGQSADIVDLVEAAIADGVTVTANQYPWQASGTRFSNALIPRWVQADSEEKMRERLDSADLAPRIETEMLANLERRGGPGAMLVTGAESPYVGMTLADIAAALEKSPLDAAVDVVLSGDPSIASFVMHPDDINHLAVQPWVMTGSDGGSGHPRFFATYPKGWQDFVENNALMSAEQYVHRSSGLVADTFGICDRGFLREGYIADIAVIDPASFIAIASYEQPEELSTGVDQLLINGVLVINEKAGNELPGQVLRKTECEN